MASSDAAKRKLPEQGGLVSWTADAPRCRSILTSQQNEMIDLGGKARRAGAGSVLRDVLLTYHLAETIPHALG